MLIPLSEPVAVQGDGKHRQAGDARRFLARTARRRHGALPDRAVVGGKAASLARLAQAGFPVPACLCLPVVEFQRALEPFMDRIQAILATVSPSRPTAVERAGEALAALLSDLALLPGQADELAAWLAEHDLLDSPLAVRSSATSEDAAEHSFAGQYRSILGVRGAQAAAAAVVSCWQSYFAVPALAARRQAAAQGGVGAGDGLSPASGVGEGMAVVIQLLVDADCAGTCFTVDPANPGRGIVVEAAWGLGEGVVDGTAGSDTYRLERDTLRIAERIVRAKAYAVRLVGEAAAPPLAGEATVAPREADAHLAGEVTAAPPLAEEATVAPTEAATERRPVPEAQRGIPVLPDEWLLRIAQFGLAAEMRFGAVQDLEWAIADGRLWILQSRPIASAAARAVAPMRAPRLLSAPGPARTIARPQDAAGCFWTRQGPPDDCVKPPLATDRTLLWEAIWDDARTISGAPRSTLLALGNGSLYLARRPTGATEADERVRRRADEWRAARLWEAKRTPFDELQPRVRLGVDRLRAFCAADADDAELAEHVEEAFAVFRLHWTWHWDMLRFGEPFYEAFARASGLSSGEARDAARVLLDGDDNVLTRLVDGVYDLAQTARGDERLAAWLRSAPDVEGDDPLAALPDTRVTPAFRRRLDELLNEHGERQGNGYGSDTSLFTPTWSEDPRPLLAMAAAYLDADGPPPAEQRAAADAVRQKRFADIVASAPDEATANLLEEGYPLMRRRAADMENHNYWIDQIAGGQLRLAIMAAGRRLAARGELVSEQDIFWLHRDEIGARLRAEPNDTLKETVARRKRQAARDRRRPHPPVVGLPSAVLGKRPAAVSLAAVPGAPRGALPGAASVAAPGGPRAEETGPCPEATGPRAEATAGSSAAPPDVAGEPAGSAGGGTVLRGVAASPGRGQGVARIVDSAVTRPKLEPGDVLVAENAGPLWTPFFPFLAGIVLDAGALTQHAANVAREYGIPAVIRTEVATRELVDGSIVEVDGDRGIVVARGADHGEHRTRT